MTGHPSARDDELRRVLLAWAAGEGRFGEVLRTLDPTWGTDVFELAGGVVALHGRGLYVNRAAAVGIEPALTAIDLDELERRCAAVGVEPAVEVSPATAPATVELLTARGYRSDDERIAFRVSPVGSPPSAVPDWLSIETVGPDRLDEWQRAAADGWGHTTAERRRASDAYAAAAARIDRPGLLLAIDRSAGAAVGCASLSIVGDLATLGGMSTVPAARRRGVQSALIRHRLQVAAAAGCGIATSQAEVGSASARNLERHGFEPWCRIETWTPSHRRLGAIGGRLQS